jgi:hypothetical protein
MVRPFSWAPDHQSAIRMLHFWPESSFGSPIWNPLLWSRKLLWHAPKFFLMTNNHYWHSAKPLLTRGNPWTKGQDGWTPRYDPKGAKGALPSASRIRTGSTERIQANFIHSFVMLSFHTLSHSCRSAVARIV